MTPRRKRGEGRESSTLAPGPAASGAHVGALGAGPGARLGETPRTEQTRTPSKAISTSPGPSPVHRLPRHALTAERLRSAGTTSPPGKPAVTNPTALGSQPSCCLRAVSLGLCPVPVCCRSHGTRCRSCREVTGGPASGGEGGGADGQGGGNGGKVPPVLRRPPHSQCHGQSQQDSR